MQLFNAGNVCYAGSSKKKKTVKLKKIISLFPHLFLSFCSIYKVFCYFMVIPQTDCKNVPAPLIMQYIHIF